MGRTKEWDNDVLATRGGFPLAEGGSQYDDPRLVLKRADATQLIDYLEELREIGEQSPAKIVQRYGQDPCATIKADIEKKLKLCGNWIREEGPRDR
jgi:hypothetical protein